MKIVLVLLFLCYASFYLCNGQTCTSPVYSNSEAIVKGPCPSSQVIAPVGSTVQFECSYSHNGDYLSIWNITNIKAIVNQNVPPNSGITVTLGGNSASGYTRLTFPATKQDTLSVQCGLCDGADVNCITAPQAAIISLPVQLISFGK